MDESFTKHPSFSLLAKNLKKTKFWSTILKSFWDFLIYIWSFNHFDPVLLPLAKDHSDSRIISILENPIKDLRISLQNNLDQYRKWTIHLPLLGFFPNFPMEATSFFKNTFE